MALIDKIFDINITRTASVPSITGFNSVMIAAEFLADTTSPDFGRYATYGSLEEITTAGFLTTSVVYLAAQAVFAQSPSVNQIYVGRKLTGIDGTETWTEALTAINLANSEWTFLGIDTVTLADQELVAAWVESNDKIVGLASADANFVDGTGDIAEALQTANYDRSFAVYDPLADRTPASTTTDKFMEFSWIGKLLGSGNDPGSEQWAYKTVSGPAAYTLSDSQYDTATGKNGNFYISLQGTDNLLFGTVGSGEYIDIIWGVDYLAARLQTEIFTLIRSATTKIPFTDGGIQLVVNTVSSVLDQFAPDFITPDYDVTFPLASEVSAQDKADRHLPDVAFTATLSGAIYKATINGVVSIL